MYPESWECEWCSVNFTAESVEHHLYGNHLRPTLGPVAVYKCGTCQKYGEGFEDIAVHCLREGHDPTSVVMGHDFEEYLYQLFKCLKQAMEGQEDPVGTKRGGHQTSSSIINKTPSSAASKPSTSATAAVPENPVVTPPAAESESSAGAAESINNNNNNKNEDEDEAEAESQRQKQQQQQQLQEQDQALNRDIENTIFRKSTDAVGTKTTTGQFVFGIQVDSSSSLSAKNGNADIDNDEGTEEEENDENDSHDAQSLYYSSSLMNNHYVDGDGDPNSILLSPRSYSFSTASSNNRGESGGAGNNGGLRKKRIRRVKVEDAGLLDDSISHPSEGAGGKRPKVEEKETSKSDNPRSEGETVRSAEPDTHPQNPSISPGGQQVKRLLFQNGSMAADSSTIFKRIERARKSIAVLNNIDNKLSQSISIGSSDPYGGKKGEKLALLETATLDESAEALRKIYTCAFCPEKFITLYAARVHEKSHGEQRPYPCIHCDKSFLSDAKLKLHETIHTEDKAFSCSICKKAFHRMDNLKVHERVHTGERPYKCSQCGDSFTVSSTLTTHMRTHTGDKPYPCRKCGKAFASSSNTKQHQKVCKKEERYPSKVVRVDDEMLAKTAVEDAKAIKTLKIEDIKAIKTAETEDVKAFKTGTEDTKIETATDGDVY